MAKVKCPVCGKRVDSSVTVCPDCGSPVEAGPAAQSIKKAKELHEGRRPSHTSAKAVFIPLIIIFVAVFLFVAVMGTLTVISFVKNFRKPPVPDIDDIDASSSIYTSIEEDDDHSHYYENEVTRQATCTTPGERTFTCSCGHSYTQSIPTVPHSYSSATCTAPRKCSVCGVTSGSALGHSYFSGKCINCGGADPAATNALNSCSLTLPSLPKAVTYGLGGTTIANVSVSGVSYDFAYEATGTVSLTVTLSGKITSSPWGSGQTTAQVGYMLYGPDGKQFKSGTIMVIGAVGAEFTSRNNTLLYSFDNAPAGKYRLELTDAN